MIHESNVEMHPIRPTVPYRAGRIGIKTESSPPPYRMYFPNVADLEHPAILLAPKCCLTGCRASTFDSPRRPCRWSADPMYGDK